MCVNFRCERAASDFEFWCSAGFYGLTLFGSKFKVGLGGVELSSLMVKSDREFDMW